MNWLCNPTGKADGFRGIDWLVELMNLYTKVVYGSSGPARTFQLILKQSPLIETFRHVHLIVQDNFHLLHRTVRHAPPDIRNTLKVLCEMLEQHQAYEFVHDRTACDLTNHLTDGMHVLQTEKTNTLNTDDEDDSG